MKLIIQNIATEYHDEGKGQTLLFLHGWQDNSNAFDSLIPFLNSRFKIIRVDLPGFGKSEAPPAIWELNDYIIFVKNFISKLNLDIYALVGHSFGGRIIIKGAAEKILDTEKIILISSAGISQNSILRNLLFKILAKAGALITFIPPLIFWRKKFRETMYRALGSDYLEAGDLKETYLKIIKEDLSSSAQKITTPALLIWGADDRTTSLKDGKRLSQLIPNAKLEIIDQAGHFVCKEKPQEVAELISEFLS